MKEFLFECALWPTQNLWVNKRYGDKIYRAEKKKWRHGKHNGGAEMEIFILWHQAGKPRFEKCHIGINMFFTDIQYRDDDNHAPKFLFDTLKKDGGLGIIKDDSNNLVSYSLKIHEGADQDMAVVRIMEGE